MDNPYEAPMSNLSGTNSLGGFGQGGVTRGVIQQLARTKGWVRFLSVLGWIGAVFMLLGGLGMIAGAALMAKSTQATGGAAVAPGMFIGIGVVYFLSAFVSIYPAYKLFRYASSIGRLIYSGLVADLEDAVEQQRGFWKFTGVVLIIWIVFLVAAIVLPFIGFVGLTQF